MVAQTAEVKRLRYTGSRLKKSLDSFADDTTLHGLRNICSSQSGMFRKLLWFALLLVMSGTCIYMASQSVSKYLSYESITRVEKKTVSKLDFPAVSICDQNLFSRNAFISEQLKDIVQALPIHQDKLEDIIQKFHSNQYDEFNETEFAEATEILNQLSLYDLVRQSSKANFDDSELFFDCKFDGTPFNCRTAFRFLMTQNSACYTFQSERTVLESGLMYTERPGFKHGLELTINLNVVEPFVTSTNGFGLMVVIHDPFTYPRIEEQAFAIEPGVEAYVKIEQITRKDLNPPYSDVRCHLRDDPWYFEHEPMSKYNFEGCMLNCMYDYSFVPCRCGFTKRGSCTVAQYYLCVQKGFEEYYNKGCGCLQPCESTAYSYQVSMLHYPVPMILNRAKFQNWTHQTEEAIHKNMLQMYIYYGSMQTSIIQQVPAYLVQELIANIGGQLGLFLGASIITLIEMLEFCVSISFRQCFRLGEKQHICKYSSSEKKKPLSDGYKY